MIGRLDVLSAIAATHLILAAAADTTAIDLSRSIETISDRVGPSVVEISRTSRKI
jgi:hypothetical protein